MISGAVQDVLKSFTDVRRRLRGVLEGSNGLSFQRRFVDVSRDIKGILSDIQEDFEGRFRGFKGVSGGLNEFHEGFMIASGSIREDQKISECFRRFQRGFNYVFLKAFHWVFRCGFRSISDILRGLQEYL